MLLLEDPVLEAKFSGGNPAYLQDKFEQFKELIPYLEKELKRKYVTRKLLWEEYREEQPHGYGYSQFCFHLSQLLIARKKGSAVLTHEPGNELYVDFAGDTMGYVHAETGEFVKVQVFVAALPFSNYAYALAVPSQTTDDFIYVLQCCLKALGGIPKILVPDNLKAAVIKADKYEPTLNKILEDFANHYGFVVIPARPGKPQDKSDVESEVNLIYQRVYAKLRNQVFFNITDLNTAITQKVKEHNQTRMQQFEYSREEKYLAEEKIQLKPLPETDFEIKYYAQLRTRPNCCVYLARDKHHYSFPFQYIGIQVDLIYTRTLVQIYKEGTRIATHPRGQGYGYTTNIEHFASTHQHYMQRSPAYYIAKAEKKSVTLTKIIRRIFELQKVPEIAFRNCDALLSLQGKTDPIIFEQACNIAFDNDLLNYKRLESIIRACAKNQELPSPGPPLPIHNNVRGKDYYN